MEEALDLLRVGFRPTVVLLDINLPGASGWNLLRGTELAAAGSPPVYVVSATSIPTARLHEYDIAGFLPKPFALPTLVDIVERTAVPDDVAAASRPAGETAMLDDLAMIALILAWALGFLAFLWLARKLAR